MDRLESLSTTLSQITMYDIKTMYNQAKNVVFNVSEMEAKVRDATNDEPWGASSTLMQEISAATFNFQNFNEIMPAIYARFMEKEAKQWRQIYKALQLLEYLVKNGSERVVDDARSHVATIKMLRNFYYIDDKGKDQGINVRNRSRELVELLGDVEKIRTERRKAKQNKHKYIGTGNDALSFSSGGSRYGGFGSESMGYGGGSGGYGGDRYDNGDSSYSGGGGSGGFRDETSRRGFQEYDAGDDEDVPKRSNSVTGSRQNASGVGPRRASTLPTVAPVAPPPKAQEVDLLGIDDDAFGGAISVGTNKALPAVAPLAEGGDDDFDDFQTAPVSPAAAAVPANNLTFLASSVAAPPQAQPLFSSTVQQAPIQTTNVMQPMNAMRSMSPPMQPLNAMRSMSPPMQLMNAMQPMNFFGGAPASSAVSSPARTPYTSSAGAPMQAIFPSQPAMAPNAVPSRSTASPAVGGTASRPASSANFDDLWSMSLGSSAGKTPAAPAGAGKSIKDLEKEKAQAGIWGSGQNRPPMGGAFGSFAGASTPSAAAPPSSSSGGLDDLLF
ncbi:ENTH-domain-containing protein [Amylocystis lapponica]|nr:ENTH-domain-containing protein [Amylocystis lapponica]